MVPVNFASVIQTLLNFIGSLGFLMYGMRLMSDGVQKGSGEKLQRTLGSLTGNAFKGLLTGLGVTMIIQSSGATSVMVISFVNAGLLTLEQAVPVIFGANIGTTITAWIVSIFGFNFKLSTFAIPMFGIGFFMSSQKKQSIRNWGEAIMGFGALFLGLGWLSDLFSFDASQLTFLITMQSWGVFSLILAFLIGITVTALIHSSSAFSAIVITMAYNNIVTWEIAAAMTLGGEIGSTIDAILAAGGSKNPDAKRVASVHVMFNTFGTLLAFLFFRPFLELIEMISPGDNIAIRISVLHTVFKTLTTVVAMPTRGYLIRLSRLIVKDGAGAESGEYKLDFTESTISKDSAAAHIIRLEKEIRDMADIVVTMFDRIETSFEHPSQAFCDEVVPMLEREEAYLDQMNEAIVKYALNCEGLPLTESQRTSLATMTQITGEVEAMSDECYTMSLLLKRSVEKELHFPEEDMKLLVPYLADAKELVFFIHANVNRKLTKEQLTWATERENAIDQQKRDLKKIARKRLEKGADVKTELLYIDIVRRIEKLGDHAFNISEFLSQSGR